MNERIKELVEEAGLEMCSCGCNMPTRQSMDLIKIVVQECVDVIQREVSMKYKNGGETEEFMGGHYASSVLARAKIKQHFGVE